MMTLLKALCTASKMNLVCTLQSYLINLFTCFDSYFTRCCIHCLSFTFCLLNIFIVLPIWTMWFAFGIKYNSLYSMFTKTSIFCFFLNNSKKINEFVWEFQTVQLRECWFNASKNQFVYFLKYSVLMAMTWMSEKCCCSSGMYCGR